MSKVVDKILSNLDPEENPKDLLDLADEVVWQIHHHGFNIEEEQKASFVVYVIYCYLRFGNSVEKLADALKSCDDVTVQDDWYWDGLKEISDKLYHVSSAAKNLKEAHFFRILFHENSKMLHDLITSMTLAEALMHPLEFVRLYAEQNPSYWSNGE